MEPDQEQAVPIQEQQYPEPDPIQAKIAELRSREIVKDQRTDDWLTARHNYITASTSAACAGLMGETARNNMILEKVTFGEQKGFYGNAATRKGTLFEPITNQLYSLKTGKTINMFSLIAHDNPEYSFLGASTDGVSSQLDNIEIKTLVSREHGKIKREYYHQMQHQMECLGLQATDFIEASYTECEDRESWLSSPSEHRGAIIVVPSSELPIYSPIDDVNLITELVDKLQEESEGNMQVTYWCLKKWCMRRVDRDPSWIINVGPLLQAFWKDVMHYRSHPEELCNLTIKKPKSRKINTEECLF
jgi:putative phage-type endonuclease